MTEDIPGWPWRPDLCPADLHYGEYLLQSLIGPDLYTPKVLHVGTGLHHHIGLLLGSRGWAVHGLSVSREEFVVDLTNSPHSYIRQLGDIRDPDLHLWDIGPVDSMSLFHLGEPPERPAWGLHEREVTERALTWSREVVFYTGSAAYDRILPLVATLAVEGKMEHVATYKSLVAYRPTHG